MLKFHWYFINHSELNFSFCFSLQEYEQMSILSRGWKNRKKRRRREKKGVTNWLHSETGNWIYFEWQTLFERVHTHTRTHTHTYTVTHTQTHIRTHTHTPTSHHTHTNTHTNIRILTHTHTHVHTISQFVSFISFLRIVSDSPGNGCEKVSLDNLSRNKLMHLHNWYIFVSMLQMV